MADYIPAADDALLAWSNNFEKKLALYAAVLNLDANSVTSATEGTAAMRNAVNNALEARASAKKATEEKRETLGREQLKLRLLVKSIKANKSYTAAMGHDLGITPIESSSITVESLPALSADVHPGYIVLKFTKKNIEGVNIYTRLKGESKWVKLSYDSHSPYTDTRPTADGKAENREYMCIGVLHDEEVGQQSDIVSVAFGG